MLLLLLTYLFSGDYLVVGNCKFYGVWTEYKIISAIKNIFFLSYMFLDYYFQGKGGSVSVKVCCAHNTIYTPKLNNLTCNVSLSVMVFIA
jgi:hypothetical protein